MTLDRRTFLLAMPALLAGCTYRHPVPNLYPDEPPITPRPLNGPFAAENQRKKLPIATTTNTAQRKTVATKTARKSALKTAAVDPYYASIYGAKTNEKFPVAAINLQQVDSRFWRREVSYPSQYGAGTIVVDPDHNYCYFILGSGKAIRYGVGVAKTAATDFQGQATIGRKAEWPSWRPTDNMMRKQPQRYGHLGGGMAGGPRNPLGARALYLYRNGKDTLFRLHGTTEPWSIGKRVSSGCIRFLNQDIIDLYSRVAVGAKVVVLPHVRTLN